MLCFLNVVLVGVFGMRNLSVVVIGAYSFNQQYTGALFNQKTPYSKMTSHFEFIPEKAPVIFTHLHSMIWLKIVPGALSVIFSLFTS